MPLQLFSNRGFQCVCFKGLCLHNSGEKWQWQHCVQSGDQGGDWGWGSSTAGLKAAYAWSWALLKWVLTPKHCPAFQGPDLRSYLSPILRAYLKDQDQQKKRIWKCPLFQPSSISLRVRVHIQDMGDLRQFPPLPQRIQANISHKSALATRVEHMFRRGFSWNRYILDGKAQIYGSRERKRIGRIVL